MAIKGGVPLPEQSYELKGKFPGSKSECHLCHERIKGQLIEDDDEEEFTQEQAESWFHIVH